MNEENKLQLLELILYCTNGYAICDRECEPITVEDFQNILKAAIHETKVKINNKI